MDSDMDAAGLRGRGMGPSNGETQHHHDHHDFHDHSQEQNIHHYHLNHHINAYDLPHHFHPEGQFTTQSNSPPSRFASASDPDLDLPSPNFHHDQAAVTPDDFYKSYRAHYPDAELLDDMPSASSSLPRPAVRLNGEGHGHGHGHGGTSKPGAINPNRTLPRPSNLRSTSSPVGSKPSQSAGKTPSGKPSVKDLKKRFDQGEPAAPSVPRASPQAGTTTRSRRDGTTAPKSRQSGSSYSSIRSGVAQGSTTGTSSRTQRSKFVAEDPISQNVQSFASRVGKPRTLASGNPNSATSRSHMSPGPSPPISPRSPPKTSDVPAQGLLFGEILPDQYDTSALGFGIENVRPRGFSEADNHGQWGGHQRSFSDPDIEPSSPTHWYRSATSQDNQVPPELPGGSSSRGRSRSFSDDAREKSSQRISRKPISRGPAPAQTQPSSASKLPLLVRKINNSSDSSSPPSTRSNSPSMTKVSHTNGRLSRATTPTTRSKTPLSRAKTPTQQGSGRRIAPPGLLTPNSNTRLQAYISAPPPKLSPPLRSSRPRQPVSAATTASSRMKAIERSAIKDKSGHSTEPKPHESITRRRKISVGPIDFEQRREHIRLAYTKSVRESQALEARQRAAERRRKDMEAAAKAKAAAEAAATAAALENAPTDQTLERRAYTRQSPKLDVVEDNDVKLSNGDTHTGLQVVVTSDEPNEVPESSSPIINEQTPDITTPVVETPSNYVDSPALGVPGAFPAFSPPIGHDDDDDVPLSAISATSETTEFDVEPQTDLSMKPDSPVTLPITFVEPPSSETVMLRPRSEYQYPFSEEIHMAEQPAETLNRNADFSGDTNEEESTPHLIPGAFGDDDEENHVLLLSQEAEYETIARFPPDEDASELRQISTESVPFPRLDVQDDSDCHTELEDVPQISSHHDHGDAATDACSEDSDHGKTDECQSESRFGDHTSSRRASSCASSDVGDALGINHSNLMVPQMRGKRSSQQSAWTDFSVESSGPSNVIPSPDLDGDLHGEASPTYGHVTIFGSHVISRDSDSTSREVYEDRPSTRPSYSSAESSALLEQHQFPDLNTGDGGFRIPYLSAGQSVSLPHVPLPDHEPPPIPTPISASAMDSRPASLALYEQSQYDSTLNHSDRGSEDFTPQTTDTNSIGASEHWFGAPSQASVEVKAVAPDGEELPDKERRRLMQRRNVIKELVDTEAVFVRDMNIVEEIYKGTAEACPKLEDKTVKQVFRNTAEIIEFHTLFLAQIKDAVSSVYKPKGSRSAFSREDLIKAEIERSNTVIINDTKDRLTSIGPVFKDNIERMKTVHETFLRSSDQAARKLIQIQQDPTVKVWLNECNEVAKELTAAWDLDSLLIKPMQRITKYPNLILILVQHTPPDHPDRELLLEAKDILETAIIEINQTKKNFELVGQIVGRQRKGSDVKTGFARAFGKRVDKLQPTGTRPPEDALYAKLNEKFGDDYLRLQVVLRDVEFYTRQVTSYVREFLNYLSSVELIMRLQPGSYPEIESKWVQFNISIRDLEKVALDEHLAQVRKLVIEPFEQVIKAYGNPALAMKKRQKRRLDFERMEQLKRAGRNGDARLVEQVEQYEALNDTLKKELPQLSALTEKMGNICLGNFVNIQTRWYGIWKDKMKTVLGDCPDTPDLQQIVAAFEQDFPYVREQVASIGILQPTPKGRASQSTAASNEDSMSRMRSPRPSDVDTVRSRQLSVNDDAVPSLPTPDFLKRHSGSLSMSPTGAKGGVPSPYQYNYRDFYHGVTGQGSSSTSTGTLDMTAASTRSPAGTGATSTRPSTGRSFDSGGIPRQSVDSQSYRRDSNTTYNSTYHPHHPHPENRRLSGLFHSALPLPSGPEDGNRSSRASSQERPPPHDTYNILWLAASLFEFNIATTKHEAGYPYLTYQAGEVRSRTTPLAHPHFYEMREFANSVYRYLT